MMSPSFDTDFLFKAFADLKLAAHGWVPGLSAKMLVKMLTSLIRSPGLFAGVLILM